MGMYAGYYQISDAELEQLRQLEERALLEQAEELTEDETAEACDLDKMWDALHFVLTGDTLSDAADHDPLSEAVCGSDFLARQIHVGGIPSNRVKEIAQALHEVDFAARLAALQMSDFAAAEIYQISGTDRRRKMTFVRNYRSASQICRHSMTMPQNRETQCW